MVWIDYAIIGIVGFSALISLVRGFLKEAMSLVTWFVAFFIASHFYPDLAIYFTSFSDAMVRNGLDTMIGCASIPMLHNGIVSGDVASSIWRQVSQKHMAPIEFHVRPRLALPVDQLNDQLAVEPPALIKGYLRMGSKVLGPPAWDPDFNSADLPMLMRLGDLPARYRKHFLGQ